MKTEVEIEPLKPTIAGSPQEMEEGRKNSSLEPSEGARPCWHSYFRPRISRTLTITFGYAMLMETVCYGSLRRLLQPGLDLGLGHWRAQCPLRPRRQHRRWPERASSASGWQKSRWGWDGSRNTSETEWEGPSNRRPRGPRLERESVSVLKLLWLERHSDLLLTYKKNFFLNVTH